MLKAQGPCRRGWLEGRPCFLNSEHDLAAWLAPKLQRRLVNMYNSRVRLRMSPLPAVRMITTSEVGAKRIGSIETRMFLNGLKKYKQIPTRPRLTADFEIPVQMSLVEVIQSQIQTLQSVACRHADGHLRKVATTAGIPVSQ